MEMMLSDKADREYLTVDRVDKKNYERATRSFVASLISLSAAVGTGYVLIGIASGMLGTGDPEKDKDLTWDDYVRAFDYGSKHKNNLYLDIYPWLNVFKGSNAPDAQLLKNYSSLSQKEWNNSYVFDMFYRFTSTAYADALSPVLPKMFQSILDYKKSAVFMYGVNLSQFLLYAGKDIVGTAMSPFTEDGFRIVNEKFDDIDKQFGIHTGVGKAGYYGRKLIPIVGKLGQVGYGFWNLTKEDYEESQIQMKTDAAVINAFGLSVGMGKKTPQEVKDRVEMIGRGVRREYYTEQERKVLNATRAINDLRNIGKKEIKDKLDNR
jgi:hypothetical protein